MDLSSPTNRASMFDRLCSLCNSNLNYLPSELGESWDISAMWDLAIRHKVASLVADDIKGKTTDTALVGDIDRYTRRNFSKTISHTAELVRLNELFAAENISFVVFKGLALIRQFKLGLNKRHCGDMDILIADFSDLVKVDRILTEVGYKQLTGFSTSMMASKRAFTFFNAKQIEYYNHSINVQLEVHVSLFHVDLLPLRPEYIHDSRSEIVYNGQYIPAMDRDTHLLYLLIHGSIQGWHRLKWLVDIPMISGNGKAYVSSAFHARSSELGVERSVNQSLILCNRYLNMPIPTFVERSFRSSSIQVSLVRHSMSLIEEENEPGRRGLLRSVFHAIYTNIVYLPALRTGIRYKLRCVKTLVISQKDYNVLSLPSFLHWLYFFLRPILYLFRKLSGRL